MLEDTIQSGREHPTEAQALYDFLMFGRRTPNPEEEVLAILDELDIPTHQLSRNRDLLTLRIT